jgi:hypothetical protein
MKAFVTSADASYFRRFGPAFVESARKHEIPVHITICDASDEDHELAHDMKQAFPHVSFSYERIYARDGETDEARKMRYASARYFTAKTLLTMTHTHCFIMDIDSLFRNSFDWSYCDTPVGLYFRDPVAHGATTQREIDGMRCLACGWIAKNGLEYLNWVCNYITTHESQWFLDQEALFKGYEKHKDRMVFKDYSDTNILDWDMKDDTIIWTGKGPRKYNNQKYVEAFTDETHDFFKF